jgi:hypothetical protein
MFLVPTLVTGDRKLKNKCLAAFEIFTLSGVSQTVRLCNSQKGNDHAQFKRCRLIRRMLPTGCMDRTIRRYTDFDEMKADEYRYWQSRPVHERLAAVSQLTQEQYAMKGEAPDVPRLQRTLVRFERAPG